MDRFGPPSIFPGIKLETVNISLKLEMVNISLNKLETVRMLVENEATFISALKADLNKPVQETIMAEIDFLRYISSFVIVYSLKYKSRNDVIGLLREIDDWTKDT